MMDEDVIVAYAFLEVFHTYGFTGCRIGFGVFATALKVVQFSDSNRGEISTDSHYILSDEKYPVVFAYAGQDIPVVELVVNDGTSISNELIYGEIHGLKKDEDSSALAGATFGLFTTEGTEPILTAFSAADGSFSFTGVPYGEYVVREIAAPEGYVTDDTPYAVKIDADGAVVEIEAVNTRIRGSVQLTKVDRDYPDHYLTGAEFEVYRDGELVGTLEELSDGVYRLDGLAYGDYTLKETKAPAGFSLDEQTYAFSITENGGTVIVENEAGKGFVNAAQTGSLRIEKTSEDDRLQGFTFRVSGTDVTGNAFSKDYVTDENGQIKIDGLRIGDYVVSEVSNEANKAYVLPPDVTVTVHEGKTVVAKFHNQLKPVTDIPKTGDSTDLTLWAALAGASLLSAGAAAVVEAMAAGERRGVTPELRTAYSRSGLSHLLAVSGLHTGIVFALVNLALWWLPLFRRGHLLKNLLAAVAVWLFVAAAGFPPSAVRAAAMCTVLQAALASASEYVGLNALAAAGFGMLVWNPSWLGDISFQLSFVAVAAILAWGVPLCRRCRTRWKGVNVVVDAYLIGFVATVATAPLVSHTFGVVPLAGLAVNPLAIALAGVVVFGGALWMLAPVGFLAPAFGFVTGSAAEGISALARLTASLPGGAADYTLGGWPTAAVYAVFALATLAAWSGEPKKNVSLRT